MKTIKLSITLTLLCILSCTLNAQQVKLVFKELTLVTYQPNDSLKKQNVIINGYYHINGDGILHFVFNEANIKWKEGSPRLSFTGFVRDTTYRLSDDVISTLNQIFNGQQKLRSYIKINKLPQGVFLSMPGSFMTYTTNNNVTDQMIFDQEFFGRDMNMVLNKLIFSKMARQKKASGIYHDKRLEAEVIKYHKACLCIPQTEAPPTVKQLPTTVSH
jgi:hypothetical protein